MCKNESEREEVTKSLLEHQEDMKDQMSEKRKVDGTTQKKKKKKKRKKKKKKQKKKKKKRKKKRDSPEWEWLMETGLARLAHNSHEHMSGSRAWPCGLSAVVIH